MRQECNTGIRDRDLKDLKEQLRLRKDRTLGRIFRKIVELEVTKHRETGSHGNKSTCNNGGTVRNSVFYAVHAEML
jgi:hypothetical protein